MHPVGIGLGKIRKGTAGLLAVANVSSGLNIVIIVRR